MKDLVERFQNSQWKRLDDLNFSKRTILDLLEEGEVLDVGCGDGLLLEYLKKQGLEVTGIDISEKAIEICRERGLTCMQGDITSTLPFVNSSFDSVLIVDVLEHLFQPLDVLREAHRITKQNVFISVPNFVSLPARLQVMFGQVPENNTAYDGHVYWMTWSVIKELLSKSGFQIEKVVLNTFWENVPIIGLVTYLLKKINPSLFALSFIIKARKT